MANPFERFTQGVARLTAQAAELRNERSQNEQQILRLQVRQGELDGLLADIEGQTLTLAHSYTEAISHATPDRTTPEDTKPIIVSDDEDATITLTPRSNQIRPISPPYHAPAPQPVLQPLQHHIIHAKYPTVVYLDGVWTEIWCGTCGANSDRQRRTFFSGASGLFRHWNKMHMDGKSTLNASLASCGRRILDDEEVLV
ncbi:hypothetical protein LTR85_007495 [Meristemomyces frigidus]|nr:hypothetical protein LTR85_007495 [Meristemomyces frigidus]